MVARGHVDGAARLDDAGDRRGRGRRLALPGDEPFDQPRESPAHDLARLAHALELALTLPAPHGEDEIVVERPLDAGCRLPELEPVLERQDSGADQRHAADLPTPERLRDAAHRVVVPFDALGGDEVLPRPCLVSLQLGRLALLQDHRVQAARVEDGGVEPLTGSL